AFDLAAVEKAQDRQKFLQSLAQQANDLEAAAVKLAPAIGDLLAALRTLAGCRLARMSGSGATCFGIFDGAAEGLSAADTMSNKYPRWWVRACLLASAN
ncbi:MAG: 4-(cytidine 5'-diphospho)-2-C-methyl-D-erythritol kinase, partial [Xanthobacteraceae bacterium]